MNKRRLTLALTVIGILSLLSWWALNPGRSRDIELPPFAGGNAYVLSIIGATNDANGARFIGVYLASPAGRSETSVVLAGWEQRHQDTGKWDSVAYPRDDTVRTIMPNSQKVLCLAMPRTNGTFRITFTATSPPVPPQTRIRNWIRSMAGLAPLGPSPFRMTTPEFTSTNLESMNARLSGMH